MSQQKVLVLVGDAAEELDAMYPIYRLREAGFVADVWDEVARDLAGVAAAHLPGRRGEPVPDALAATVLASRALDLVRRGRRAPEEPVREPLHPSITSSHA